MSEVEDLKRQAGSHEEFQAQLQGALAKCSATEVDSMVHLSAVT